MLITEILAAKMAAQTEIARTINELCQATGIHTWEVDVKTTKLSEHDGVERAKARDVVTHVKLSATI